MILSSTIIRHPRQYFGGRVQLAFNSSFVLLFMSGNSYPHGRVIWHVDKHSNLIKEYRYEQNILSTMMVRDDKLLVALVKSNIIEVIDLRKHSVHRVQFKFVETTRSLNLYFFNSSQLVCFKESQTKSQLKEGQTNFTTLTYLDAESLTQVYKQKLNTDELGFSSIDSQGNNESMLIFRMIFQQFKVLLFELKEENGQKKPSITQLEIPNCDYPSPGTAVSVWCFQSNNLFYICNTSQRTEMKKYNIIQKALLPNKGILFSEPIVHWNLLDELMCFIVKRDVTTQIVHFVGIESEKVEFSFQLSTTIDDIVARCRYNPQMLVHMTVEEDDCKIEVKTIMVFRLRQIYMFLLLHLNQDFDDDLLLDMIVLLTYL